MNSPAPHSTPDPVATRDANLKATVASFTAFADHQRFAAGSLADVAAAMKQRTDAAEDSILLVFDDRNGRVVDLDLRGTIEDVVGRLPILEAFLFGDPAKRKAEAAAPEPKKRGPGRPKLGVVGREVTLLPRHWQWLNRQPGGASVTLRKLVETARLAGRKDEQRHARAMRPTASCRPWRATSKASRRRREPSSRAILTGSSPSRRRGPMTCGPTRNSLLRLGSASKPSGSTTIRHLNLLRGGSGSGSPKAGFRYCNTSKIVLSYSDSRSKVSMSHWL